MQSISVVVETPKGSAQKYNYDVEKKCFRLKKILPAGMFFPFDFGFIPGTIGEDGDALDVVVISEFTTFTGCMIDCRVIGCITAQQTVQRKTFRNDRFLVVPEASLIFADVKDIKELPTGLINQLEIFFINYNEIEGKKFKPLKRLNAQQALKILKPK